ncbi:spermidine/putrescine ABC transporter substrate-binding protein [Pokkaliibacter plantistimulans]|uniref:Putrescine-binding periplasmic protein n=1 Tax=Pokkaliibacter plantistimulans TaxID=1635171 RepID=A0ABX5LWA0_9GAMM|nr:polyamine ABC transporter substrate-binding protein [Pokkaliibacter plantistimulans]PXF30942.1 spermidine/putrescine ABC transporter substrate-binding protein [Pokkaliibacter plantistimulans]
MKPSFRLACAFALSSTLLVQTGFAEEKTVRIFNWIEYMPQDVLDDFQKETGIHPIYDVFDNVETLESKLLTGNSGYDVVFPGTANLGKLIKVGALEKLDRSELSNWSHLDPDFMKNLEAVGDTGNQYAVPYMWGTTLIGYNEDKVKAVLGNDVKIDSWSIVFNPEYMAKLQQCGVGFLDASSEILPIALDYLKLDPNSTNKADYKQATALIQGIRPYVRYFDSSKYGMDLANGDICMAVGWSGGVVLADKIAHAAGNGITIKMSIPKEGAPMWSDVMSIAANAQHKSEAHAFINFILRPDIIARISNAVGYPNPNVDATALVDASIRNNPNMYVSDEVKQTLFPLKAVPDAIERVRTRAWTTVKTGL